MSILFYLFFFNTLCRVREAPRVCAENWEAYKTGNRELEFFVYN